MLSRTADHLYWMSRYTERAENMARLLGVNVRNALLPRAADDPDRNWAAALATIGQLDAYRQRCGAITAPRVLQFVTFDRDNPGSIYSCLRSARENAHAVRGTLTSELWETINSTWLELRRLRTDALSDDALVEFYEWVKYRSHLSRGVTLGTMLRDEGFNFTRLGTFLERADNTARILDVQLRLIAPEGHATDADADYYAYGALLRSVSAFEIYRKVYRDRITPARLAELLVLRADMPRSLHRCINEVDDNLREVSNSQSAETERRAGELHARLHYGRIDAIMAAGLHAFLEGFLGDVRDICEGIAEDFLLPAVN